MPRKLLDRLYLAGGVLAACFLAAIAALILVQIVARYIGVLVPGALELAGYAMAASSFLALAYALRAGGHIRVMLALQYLPGRARRGFDAWSLAVGALLSGFFTVFVGQMVRESYRFDDRTPGLLDIPLWIVQAPMLAGLALLTVALLDELLQVARGRAPSFEGRGEGVLPAPERPAGHGT